MHNTFFRCYIDVHMKMGMHVYMCSKVGWLAHPLPGHGKKSPGSTSVKVWPSIV